MAEYVHLHVLLNYIYVVMFSLARVYNEIILILIISVS